MTSTKYGFEIRTSVFKSGLIVSDDGWTDDGIGEQDESNTFDTRDAALAELPRLAKVLECDESDLRVVPFTFE